MCMMSDIESELIYDLVDRSMDKRIGKSTFILEGGETFKPAV